MQNRKDGGKLLTRSRLQLILWGLLLSVILVLVVYYLPGTKTCSWHYFTDHDDDVFQESNQLEIGPLGKAEFGEPWPKPQLRRMFNDTFLVVRPQTFRFQIVNNTCDIIDQAIERYYEIIRKSFLYRNRQTTTLASFTSLNSGESWKPNDKFRGYLDVLQVNLKSPCEYLPHEKMNEKYELKINSPGMEGIGLLTAETNWGILRGLETFSQLLFISEEPVSIRIKSTYILDYPRFRYRSVLVDTARHFISLRLLKQNLDLMAMNKFNVFHWHIVDSQSFPYQSKTFPELSNKGAYHPYTHIYTQQDVADILEYARVRGIRVIPEFDTPGHTGAWGRSLPDLNPCYKPDGSLSNAHGPIDPTRKENFDFLRSFFEEVVSVFPDKFLHLGGDEVNYDCWKSSPRIRAFMKSKKWTDYAKLEEYYMQNLVDIVKSYPKNVSYVVWQEVLDNGVRINKNTIIHVWKLKANNEKMASVTSKGYRALTSACWYLNKISYGIDWYNYYDCDPHNFTGTEEQKQLVLGGGPAMWAEFVDSTNFISRLWPRASAPAERLWSDAKVRDREDASKRLDEHRCRMIKRGFSAGPLKPGFCTREFDELKD